MLHSSCREMTPSLCNSLCTPSPLETVGVHHPCSSWKTVLWQRFWLPTIAVYLLTSFCLLIKLCVPFQIPFRLHPLQDVLHSWPRPDCSHWHCLYGTQAPKTVSPILLLVTQWIVLCTELSFKQFQAAFLSLSMLTLQSLSKAQVILFWNTWLLFWREAMLMSWYSSHTRASGSRGKKSADKPKLLF